MAADQATVTRQYTTKVDYPAIYWSQAAPKDIALAAALQGYDSAKLTEPFKFCDLACGPGETVVLLAKCYPHAEFYAVDINPSHVEKAKARAEELGVENLTVLEGDFNDLDSLKLPEFDFITMMGVLSWVPLKLQRIALRNAAKILGPKGLLVTHYAAAPVAGLTRGAASMLAMLAPTDLQGTKEGAEEAFRRFSKLIKSQVGIYPQLAQQLQQIQIRYKHEPDYAVHDFFHSATMLSFEDFSDMVEENGLEYAATANLAQMLPETFVDEAQIRFFDFDGDWRRYQPLLQTLTRQSARFDIYAQAGAKRSVADVFTHGAVGDLIVDSWSSDAHKALSVANQAAKTELLDPSYVAIVDAIQAAPITTSALLGSITQDETELTAVARKLAHLVAHRVLNLIVKSPNASDQLEDATLETFPYTDDLWKYLAINRPLNVPSAINGNCLSFDNDAKIKLFLMLGGDPNKLFQRLKRIPGFTNLRTAKGEVKSGAQLNQLIQPALPAFANTMQTTMKRYAV